MNLGIGDTMFVGDINKIDLGTSSFKCIREKGCLFLDKSKFIEHFLAEANSVQVLLRQRRLGKSLNIDMLHCFLDDTQKNVELYEDLYIRNSQVWDKINSSPAFLFDFKNLTVNNYKYQIFMQVLNYIDKYIGIDSLSSVDKMLVDDYIADRGETNTNGILMLTKLAYEKTKKNSYIFIDEYDKLLGSIYNADNYDEIKEYETAVYSAALKGNKYLEKALLTGVMRVSRESILSGLNNIAIYDLFSDNVYQKDYGLTDDEVTLLSEAAQFDKDEVRQWYNGIKINGVEIYNIYSVLSYIQNKRFDNYWGRSGTIDVINNLLSESREKQLGEMLNNNSIYTTLEKRVSLKSFNDKITNSVFYSFVAQAGYLAVERYIPEKDQYELRIPNKELMNVWKEFILSKLGNADKLTTIFDNLPDLELFDRDLEELLSDKLSYFDVVDDKKNNERIYHVFTLGLLAAYKEIISRIFSNRESGDGRYDILFETNKYTIIFEFKSSTSIDKLEDNVNNALEQIANKRYHADANKEKPVIITGISFFGKKCMVKSRM